MKEFFCEWFKLMIYVLIFFIVLAIIIIPTIIADKFINNNSISLLFTFAWGFFSATFFTTIVFRKIKKKNK